MTTLVFSTAALLSILWVDLRPNWRKENRRCLWTSLLFLTAGYGILVLVGLGVPLPSPLAPVLWLRDLLVRG